MSKGTRKFRVPLWEFSGSVAVAAVFLGQDFTGLGDHVGKILITDGDVESVAVLVLIGGFVDVGGSCQSGTFAQVNSICGAFDTFWREWIDVSGCYSVEILGNTYQYSTLIGSFVVAILVALVVLGGLKRIASVSSTPQPP